jgi:hypothetical protein
MSTKVNFTPPLANQEKRKEVPDVLASIIHHLLKRIPPKDIKRGSESPAI